MESFNSYIITTAADFLRVKTQYHHLADMLPEGKICLVGNSDVGEALASCCPDDRFSWIDENSILPINDVWAVMNDHMRELLQGDTVPRGAVGWYYQQFLKYCIALNCENNYYMSWDGDTIPCRKVQMFSPDGHPYLDNKNEYHEEYFITMARLLPGLKKVIRSSFISEHMLFHTESVKQLISAIENNKELAGSSFWEKIIRAIDPMRLHKSAFSEFETYGSFIALTRPDLYRIRSWHSFRLGGEFFDPDTICERDYNWLGKDFDAISFEKNHSIKEGNGGLFDNPEYQEKLSARQMLQIAQEEANGGYIEEWDGNAAPHDPLS